MYGGRRYEGKQAEYIAANLGLRRGKGVGATSDVGFDPNAHMARLSYEMARDGIPFREWTGFTIDQLALIARGRMAAMDSEIERANEIRDQFEQKKRDDPVRFVVGLR